MNHSVLDREPVLAVCGWSGSGKTTLLEAVVPVLVRRGLRIAVVKHDAHGVMIDRDGKDSARLFAAGADVHIRSPHEQIVRIRQRSEADLEQAVLSLLRSHDLILVEGHKDTPLPKVWCHSQSIEEVPEMVSGIVECLPWDGDRVPTLLQVIDTLINDALAARQLYGGVLIGGESRRMGSPKHLVNIEGKSLLAKVEAAMHKTVERVVVLGRGEIPCDVSLVDQLCDAPGTGKGPLAGLATAFRWAPRVCWIVGACDMPEISVEAVEWLIDERRPGCWAVIPKDADGNLHPTLALYEPQAGPLIEALVHRGRWAPRGLAEWQQVRTPTIPDSLIPAWTNVNRPEELEAFRSAATDY